MWVRRTNAIWNKRTAKNVVSLIQVICHFIYILNECYCCWWRWQWQWLWQWLWQWSLVQDSKQPRETQFPFSFWGQTQRKWVTDVRAGKRFAGQRTKYKTNTDTKPRKKPFFGLHPAGPGGLSKECKKEAKRIQPRPRMAIKIWTKFEGKDRRHFCGNRHVDGLVLGEGTWSP